MLAITINLLSLLRYPTKTITTPHMPLETSCVTTSVFIPSLAFSYTIHAPLSPILPSCQRNWRHIKLGPHTLELSHSNNPKAKITKT